MIPEVRYRHVCRNSLPRLRVTVHISLSRPTDYRTIRVRRLVSGQQARGHYLPANALPVGRPRFPLAFCD
jgi:hypothetical protein